MNLAIEQQHKGQVQMLCANANRNLIAISRGGGDLAEEKSDTRNERAIESGRWRRLGLDELRLFVEESLV